MATLVKTDQLLVSRQDPRTRRYSTVGTLMFDGEGYTFEYAPLADHALPGLPFGQSHRSTDLFPIFAERVIDPRRPDRVQTLRYLGLSEEASPLEIMAVSGGRRTGDTYELTPLPRPGHVSLPFLVHGVRHLSVAERRAIDDLEPGDRLTLRRETTNPVTDRALLVTRDGARLGYVPTPLLTYIHTMAEGQHEIRVDQVNPADAGMHMRLLVRIEGEYVP